MNNIEISSSEISSSEINSSEINSSKIKYTINDLFEISQIKRSGRAHV